MRAGPLKQIDTEVSVAAVAACQPFHMDGPAERNRLCAPISSMDTSRASKWDGSSPAAAAESAPLHPWSEKATRCSGCVALGDDRPSSAVFSLRKTCNQWL